MSEPTIVVGKVTNAHGVRGEVSVLVLSEVPDRFAEGSAVWLQDGRRLVVEAAREDRGRLLIRFGGVGDRETAEALRGSFLVVPESALPELPEGSWWPHQLEGSEVLTEDGRTLGTLDEVVLNPANDLWVTRDAEHELLIPALRDVIVSVDVDAKRVVVRDIPGLTTPEAEAP